MAAKTEHHRKIAERMSLARAQASYPVMSRAEFLAQTPSANHFHTRPANNLPGFANSRSGTASTCSESA
jgi:hypothetical protein